MDQRVAWMDLSAGVAGDMVLGALLDAGASIDAVRRAVDAVLPVAVELSAEPVLRAGLRATRAVVSVVEAEPVRRRWAEIRDLVSGAELTDRVRATSLAVFRTLAGAEGRVHGIATDDVHFHEIGAVDSIADIVGSCAAMADLGLETIGAGPIALGSGEVRTEHGTLAVPVPAVLELVQGWTVAGGGSGELATPTGVALVTTLARPEPWLPEMRVDAVGVGAGSRDTAGRANVVRIVVGWPGSGDAVGATSAEMVVEANVDDLDPRIWPAVLAALLDAGASDAWLTPILMKKGRPAHTVHALGPVERIPHLRQVMFAQTSTIGVRLIAAAKYALPRLWVPIEAGGRVVRIKIAYQDETIVRATPEFEDVSALATASGRAAQAVLAEAVAAAAAAGLTSGAPLPASVRTDRT